MARGVKVLDVLEMEGELFWEGTAEDTTEDTNAQKQREACREAKRLAKDEKKMRREATR